MRRGGWKEGEVVTPEREQSLMHMRRPAMILSP